MIHSTLIILRGNSGSGKTTLANQLQELLGENTLVVSQDIVRREMLKSPDDPNNLSIGLIQQIAQYGKGKVDVCIVEGNLVKERYYEMLQELIAFYDDSLIYFFDVPFEETLLRHQTRKKVSDFGESEMKSWWLDDDYLDVPGEAIFSKEMTLEGMVSQVVKELAFLKSRSKE